MDGEQPFVLSVDPEHAGLRLAIVGLFIATAVILYTVIGLLTPAAEGINLLAVGGGLAGAAIMTQVADGFFKQRWKSGRVLRIVGDKIQLAVKDKVQREIDGSQHVNVLLWRFEINKRTRIPKGWYMIALALQQDDLYLPIYTFVSPEDYNTLAYNKQYVMLQKQPDEKDMRLAGQQRRLRMAEDARWIEGGEMSKDDYVTYVNRLRHQFPEWMPQE
jgi:hypothetical protein